MKFFSEMVADFRSAVFGLKTSIRAGGISLSPPLLRFLQPFKHKCQESKSAFSIHLLSAADPPLGLYFYIHGHIENDKISFLRIDVDRKPTGEPPEEVKNSSNLAGGYPDGWEKFSALLVGKSECKISAEFLTVDEKKWKPKVLRRRSLKPVGKLRFENEELSYADSKSESRLAVTLGKKGSYISLKVSSQTELVLDSKCFEEAASCLWKIAVPFFVSK